MNNTTLNTFELYYNDYKKYESFFEAFNKEQMDGMKQNVEELFKSDSLDEDAMQLVLNTRVLPNLYAKDLDNLKEKLLVAFDFVQDSEEISSEVKAELKDLGSKRNKPLFTIEGSKAVEVDTTKINYYKQTLQDKNFIQHSIELARSIVSRGDFTKE